ncbi:hypothetical protein [Amycolatopsis arida]|uniref:hypothetical protein n=1 Tax=Amycolatopsis arida TaxID=587909 RepID=UPI001066DB62|nr:hypothetical protein [Amycolatopsis arida]TDX84958.1 hypothetical protein CLV69_11742 [Amycolatopsis arida]
MSTWTVESLLAAAADHARDRITAHGGRIRIDGRAAGDSELRLLADLVHSGLVDLNTQVRPGTRCCWITTMGRWQLRRWSRFVKAEAR